MNVILTKKKGNKDDQPIDDFEKRAFNIPKAPIIKIIKPPPQLNNEGKIQSLEPAAKPNNIKVNPKPIFIAGKSVGSFDSFLSNSVIIIEA